MRFDIVHQLGSHFIETSTWADPVTHHIIQCLVSLHHPTTCETSAEAINVVQDLDGDSRMHSSSSSDEGDSDSMFPAEHEPPGSSSHHQNSTRPNVSHGYPQSLPEAAASTPPQSQDNDHAMDMEMGNDRLSENGPSGAGQKSVDLENEPGAAWNNKKAIEEYRRALTQIEDKNFSLSECHACMQFVGSGLIVCRGVWRPVR